MERIASGIRSHKVILVQGLTNRLLLEESIYRRFPYVEFSELNFNLKKVESALTTSRWDGKKPTVVLHRCEKWVRDIAKCIRKRQSNQAVILVVDGYSAFTPQIKSLVNITVSIGRAPATLFSVLKRERVNLAQALDHTDLDTILDQIHMTNADDLELAMTLSEVDVLRRKVPQDILEHCLPPLRRIEYTSTKQLCTKLKNTNTFLSTIAQPLVAKNVGYMLTGSETREYLRYAHEVSHTPNIMRCPRDDPDPKYVAAVNDKLRVFSVFTKRRGKRPRHI